MSKNKIVGGAKSMHRDFMQASRHEQRANLCLRRIEARIEAAIVDVNELKDPHVSFKHDDSGAIVLEIGLWCFIGYHERVFLLIGDLLAGGALAEMSDIDLFEYVMRNHVKDKQYL